MAEPDLTYPPDRLGWATIAPDAPIVAGQVGTWTITLTVGTVGIDEGGTIKIAQRFASDSDTPQFADPDEPGYCTVRIEPVLELHNPFTTRLRARFDRKGHERPWMQCIVIDVYDGSLAPGDRVILTLGDRSGGSPGFRAQTFVESKHDFKIFVDPTNACVSRAIANSPALPIVAGQLDKLRLTVPAQTIVGQTLALQPSGQDAWGNFVPCSNEPHPPVFTWQGSGDLRIDHNGLATFYSAGQGVFVVTKGERTCQSNPITIHATCPRFKKFWGDLHAQSDATVGTGSEEEYFRFARDVAQLDFCSHQGNDFQMTDADWQRLNRVVRQFHQDGSFVVFPGYEWSGNTTAGGDRNVWYLHEDMPIFRSSHWQIPHTPETDATSAPTAGELYKKLRGLIQENPHASVLCGAHVGGRYADIKLYFDQQIGPLVELVSCWGVFEWMLSDALDAGYVVGVMCNSDGHKGRPGAEGPGAGQFGIANGLTCVLATDQTRQAIWDALSNRRCYGTTGARISVDLTIDQHPIGQVVNNAPSRAKLWARVDATAPIEKIEVFAGNKLIHTHRPAAFAERGSSNRIRVHWRGSRIRGRGRRVRWDGAIQVAGAKIISAQTFAFDTPMDGVTRSTDTQIDFRSHTTGDTDGIDLLLDDATTGTIRFISAAGEKAGDLALLTSDMPIVSFDMGGLDMRLTIERYPVDLVDTHAQFALDLTPPDHQRTAYFIKVTQEDGHLAWTSPIYLVRS